MISKRSQIIHNQNPNTICLSILLTLIRLLFITGSSRELSRSRSGRYTKSRFTQLSTFFAFNVAINTQTHRLQQLSKTRPLSSTIFTRKTMHSPNTRFYRAGQPMVTQPAVVQLCYAPTTYTKYCTTCTKHRNSHHSPTAQLQAQVWRPTGCNRLL